MKSRFLLICSVMVLSSGAAFAQANRSPTVQNAPGQQNKTADCAANPGASGCAPGQQINQSTPPREGGASKNAPPHVSK